MQLKSFLIIAISSIILAISCKSKIDNPDTTVPKSDHPQLLICNEGNYGGGNASLSVLDLTDHTIYNKVYAAANNQQELGDVLMHAYATENEVLLVVNNSNTINILDKKSFKEISKINIRQPRYIIPIPHTNQAYVTSMYHHRLYVLDLGSLTITDSISMPYANVEHISFWEDQAIVSHWDTNCNYIHIMNAQHRIVDSIALPTKSPIKSLVDKNGQLWTLSGNMDKGIASKLYKIDLQQKNIIQQFDFQINSNNDILKLQMNKAKDMIYFLGINYNFQSTQNGLYKMNINATSLPNAPFIAAGAYQYFWDYLIDESADRLYITDPRGFVQKGDVLVYNLQGEYQTKYETHIGPSFMLYMQ